MSTGTMSKHQALQQPLPWRDQIEALPDNARLNITATNALSAAEKHYKRQHKGHYREIVYWPPAGACFRAYIGQREIEILLALESGQWVQTTSLKGVAETRRPLATLREFGLIIATCHRHGEADGYQYLLLGRVDLAPLPQVVADAVPVVDLLPDRTTAARMERQRATAAYAKRLALIEKRAAYLSPTPQQQLPLPETAA